MNKFLKDVEEFQKKFGLTHRPNERRQLSAEEFNFACKAIMEELAEFCKAWTEKNFENQTDALVDLVYFTLGRAIIAGMPFDQAWNRVHHANMQKQRAMTPEESKRGSTLDVIKPDGWEEPRFEDLRFFSPLDYYRPRLFIVEGPDACGKTTFSNYLAQRLDAGYIHMAGTKSLFPAMNDYSVNCLENAQFALLNGKHFVFDRMWPSELCYGGHFRGKTEDDSRFIANMVKPFKPIYIFCMDHGCEPAADRHEEHIDEAHPYKRDDFVSVYQNYDSLLNRARRQECSLFSSDDIILEKTFQIDEDPIESCKHFVDTQLAQFIPV